MLSSSPSPQFHKTSHNEIDGGDMELLRELVTLNHALNQQETTRSRSLQYPSYSGKQMHATAVPSPTKYMLFSGGRFSSTHEPRGETNDDVPVVQNEDGRFLPPLYPRPLSMDVPGKVTPEPGVTTSHHSFSDLPHGPSPLAHRQSDIRARRDRNSSLDGLNMQQTNQSYAHEINHGFSQRFDASSTSDTKKSVWSWKPLRALSHLGRQRFPCVFSLHVHEIEGLPRTMDGLRLCVHMRKMETKEGAVQTMPSRVFSGIAEFEETLCMKCTLYSNNRGYSSATKFLPKDIIISVMSPDMDGINFGRHQISLSKLLSYLMDSLEGQEGDSWDMKFDLTGKAKEAKLVVTFRCEVLDKDPVSFDHSSSRFIFSSSYRSSSQLSYNFSSSAHSTPGPVSVGYPVNFNEQGDKYRALLEMESFNLDEAIPSIEAGDGHVTDVQKAVPSSKTTDVQLVYETEGDAQREEEIDFIVIDRGIETSSSVQKPQTEEVTTICQEPNANELEEKYPGENTELDVDWDVVEILEVGSVGNIEQEKEDELPSNWESFTGNKVKSVQRPVFSEQHLGNALVGAPEAEICEDENEKIISVDEGGQLGMMFQTVAAYADSPSIEESNVKELQTQTEERTKIELSAIDIKEIIDKSFDKTSPMLPLVEIDANIQTDVNLECANKQDLDDEIDLVTGEFLRFLESEKLT